MQPLFRGKTPTGEWVYGDLVHSFEGVHIVENDYFKPSNGASPELTEVIPESVGQFSGLLDKNGKEIYEGDIFIGCTYYENPNDEYEWTLEKPGIITFGKGYFYPLDLNHRWRCDLIIEIIGNVTDNPDLLHK